MNWNRFFTYKDGELYWKERPITDFVSERAFKVWNAKYKGMRAGTIRNCSRTKKYAVTCVNNKRFYVHRIIWEVHNGHIATGLEIDHIDGDGLNNDPSNLRVVTHHENGKNTRMKSNNNSGLCGVTWSKRYGKFQAYIKANGKYLLLGRFDLMFDAACARKSAEIAHGFHENHGSRA